MDYKKSYSISRVGLIGGFVVAFVGCGLTMKFGIVGSVIGLIGLAMMAFGLIQAFMFYKCPKCDKRFNLRGVRPNHCPFCGHNLEE